MRPLHALFIASLPIVLGTSALYGQEPQIQIQVSGPGTSTSTSTGKDVAKQVAKMVDPGAFQHVSAGPNIVAVLQANGQYSQFLGLVERAGLRPLLEGKVQDTTYAAVTFRESVDSGQNPLLTSADIKLPGNLPSDVNTTDLRDQVLNSLDSVYTEAKKYALAQDGLLTVFAPTNAAFAATPKSQIEQLTHDSVALVAFVRAHIVTKGVYAQGLPKIKTLQSRAGSLLPVGQATGGGASVGGVAVVGPELVARNGVVHGLGAVLPWPTAPSTP